MFKSLSVKITNGQRRPNKAIMLLSVIDLIRCGYLTENKIYIDDAISEAFHKNWKMFLYDTSSSPWTPFWHMKREPFWHFMPKHSQKEIEGIARPGETAPIGKMKRSIMGQGTVPCPMTNLVGVS